jgi:ribosome maturation factor RimP
MAAVEKLEELLSPVVEDLGYEFIGVDYSANPKNRLLRLYIDRPDSGIGVDDCETVSREVSAVLDVEEPIRDQYTLEVSSPGVERPLFSVEHFRRFLGEMAAVRMQAPQEGRRKFKGRIARVEDDRVWLNVDGTEWCLAIADMEKARLAPDLDALFADKSANGLV